MQDAWRSYLELALGFTEAPRKKAMSVARTLTERSGVTVEQLRQIAEDLTETSAANREALVKLVRYELDRALAAVGLATAEEVGELATRVRELEDQLRDAEARVAAAETQAAAGGTATATVPGQELVTPSVSKTPAKRATKNIANTPATKAAKRTTSGTKAAKSSTAAKPVKKSTSRTGSTGKRTPGGAGGHDVVA